MTHRIKTVKVLRDFTISVIFQDGTEKEYDVRILYENYPQFRMFEQKKGLFEQIRVDTGGYGISWSDELDLASEEIWQNGKTTGKKHDVDIKSLVGTKLTEARNSVGITQKDLAERVDIYQGDISKIERGLANPSVQTLQRLASGMGMNLKIEFVKGEL